MLLAGIILDVMRKRKSIKTPTKNLVGIGSYGNYYLLNRSKGTGIKVLEYQSSNTIKYEVGEIIYSCGFMIGFKQKELQ